MCKVGEQKKIVHSVFSRRHAEKREEREREKSDEKC